MQIKSLVKKINRLFCITPLLCLGLSGVAFADNYNVKIDAPSVNEGGTLQFTVTLVDPLDNTTLKAANGEEVLVDWTTSDAGVAQGGSDFTANFGTVTFAAGQNTNTFDVATTADTDVETDETLRVVLSNGRTNPAGGTVDWATNNETDGTITDDDSVTATLSAPVQQNEDAGNYTFTVTLDQAITDTNVVATLAYETNDGTATVANSDYTDNDAIGIDLTTGATVFTFDVPITADTDVERPEETFTFAITDSTANVTVVSSPQTGRIIDDDIVTATLSAPVQQTEGSGNYTFTVTLDQAIADPNAVATLDYETNDGTATVANLDYTDNDASGINLATGATEFHFDVPIINDTEVELAEETFTFGITGSTSNVNVAGSPATGKIIDDDQVVATLSGPTDQFESAGNYRFTVTLNNAINDPNAVATLDYETNDGTATVANLDYTDNDASGVDLATGATVFTFDVPITDDATVELDDETFTFKIVGSTTNIIVSNSSATGTIIDDDHDVIITPVNTEQPETTSSYAFEIEVDPPVKSGENVSVHYTTSDDTTTAGSDYTVTAADIDFTASTLNPYTITVPILEDTSYEGDEIFSVTTSTGSGSTTGDLNHGVAANGTITDPYSISITDVSVVEEYTDTTMATVTVSLDRDNDNDANPITVNYTTNDSGAATATADSDYTTKNATLTFNSANPLSQVINVEILADEDIEGPEIFTIDLSNPSPSADVTITDNSGTVTIDDNTGDFIVNVLPDFTFEEGQTTPATAIFSFQLNNDIPAGQEVVIDYTTADGTAVAGSDYTTKSGQITLPAGTLAADIHTISVDVTADGVLEGEQDFFMNFTAVSDNFTLNRAQQKCTIQDHDFEVGFTGSVSVTEDGNNTATPADPERAVLL